VNYKSILLPLYGPIKNEDDCLAPMKGFHRRNINDTMSSCWVSYQSLDDSSYGTIPVVCLHLMVMLKEKHKSRQCSYLQEIPIQYNSFIGTSLVDLFSDNTMKTKLEISIMQIGIKKEKFFIMYKNKYLYKLYKSAI